MSTVPQAKPVSPEKRHGVVVEFPSRRVDAEPAAPSSHPDPAPPGRTLAGQALVEQARAERALAEQARAERTEDALAAAAALAEFQDMQPAVETARERSSPASESLALTRLVSPPSSLVHSPLPSPAVPALVPLHRAQPGLAPKYPVPDPPQPVTTVQAPSGPLRMDSPHLRKGCLRRWLFPGPENQDKRRAARNNAPGLVAHFWTGGAPQAHPVRDISASGLFVMTTERWYLGTRIRVTLTHTPENDTQPARTLTVQAVAVRWADDGVGLAFVPAPPPNGARSQTAPSDGADARQLLEFVQALQDPSIS